MEFKLSKYNVLMMGASYGSLLASKLLACGHNVHFIALPQEVELINKEGFRIHMPVRGRGELFQIDSRKLRGRATAGTPHDVQLSACDLVGLAMQEPQYRLREVRDLLSAVARAKLPCVSIMNMPPLPYLQRIPGIEIEELKSAYTEPSVWDEFQPELVTLCSPDPQAIRLPEQNANVLHVTLPTNFKVAQFTGDERNNAMLRQLESEIDAARFRDGTQQIELPVKLRVRGSVFAPLAKWSMLAAGNYRCITESGIRTAQEAVWSDPDTSRSIYNFVFDLCLKLGAESEDLVPFEKYASAAQSLVRPASVARALANGAPYIERADKLVQLIAGQNGMSHPELDRIVDLIDSLLKRNRGGN